MSRLQTELRKQKQKQKEKRQQNVNRFLRKSKANEPHGSSFTLSCNLCVPGEKSSIERSSVITKTLLLMLIPCTYLFYNNIMMLMLVNYTSSNDFSHGMSEIPTSTHEAQGFREYFRSLALQFQNNDESTKLAVEMDEDPFPPFVFDTNLSALYLGTIDDETQTKVDQECFVNNMNNDKNDNSYNKQKRERRVHFIISHCDKSISWIWDEILMYWNDNTNDNDNDKNSSKASSHTFVGKYGLMLGDITIYSKCGNPVHGLPTPSILASLPILSSINITVHNLPNVGRCDHTYSNHLCQYSSITPTTTTTTNTNYHPDDILFFHKDNTHRTKVWVRRSWEEIFGATIRNGFACFEQGEIIEKSMLASYYHVYKFWKTFQMDKYVRETSRDTNEAFKSPLYSSFSDWLKDVVQFKDLNEDLIPVCYGGVFATTWRQVSRVASGQHDYFINTTATVDKSASNYSLPTSSSNVWCRITNSLSRANNLAEGHYCERIWAVLLSKPLRPQSAQTLRYEWNPGIQPQCKDKWNPRCGILTYRDYVRGQRPHYVPRRIGFEKRVAKKLILEKNKK